MSREPIEHFRWFLENGVAVVEVLSRELNQPAFAQELGAQLRALLATKPAEFMLINFHKTRYMSSTAFAVLFETGKLARGSNVRLVLCGFDPDVRVGADILSLGDYIPIVDDEPAALAALRAGETA
jgi:anti-anti-sigma factor